LLASEIDTLPKYLDTFQEQIGERYVGIRMNSVFFGRGPNETNHSKNHDIDYVWRQKGDPGKFMLERYKLIVNVTCNDFLYIHYQKTSDSCRRKNLWNANANDLRFNHYKLPSRGVFKKERKRVHSPENVVRDTSLVNERREELMMKIRLEKIASQRKSNERTSSVATKWPLGWRSSTSFRARKSSGKNKKK